MNVYILFQTDGYDWSGLKAVFANEEDAVKARDAFCASKEGEFSDFYIKETEVLETLDGYELPETWQKSHEKYMNS